MEYVSNPDNASKEIISEIADKKQKYRDFIENAAKTSNPFHYIKAFSKIENIEDYSLIHRIIKGRKDIRKVREYGKNPEKEQIKKAFNEVMNKTPGSGKEFSRLLGIDLEKDSYLPTFLNFHDYGIEEFVTYRLNNEEVFRNALKSNGLIYTRYYDDQNDKFKPFLTEINSLWQVNGTMPAYVIKDSYEKNLGGFYDPRSKNIFVIQNNRNHEKKIIQHELEHLIQDKFKMHQDNAWTSTNEFRENNSKMKEYGAFLGELRFSDDIKETWGEDIILPIKHMKREEMFHKHGLRVGKMLGFEFEKTEFKKDCHALAREKILSDEIKLVRKAKKRDESSFAKEISQLHDRFYKKNIDITYTELEELCK
jgi:hypothetical protein